MQNVVTFTVGKIAELMHIGQETYRVNPVLFLMIYVGSAPVYYYALYRVVRAFFNVLREELRLWSTVFLVATAAPFLYVLFFGRNLPWWSYLLIALIVLQAVGTLVWKLRQLPAPRVRAVLTRVKAPPLLMVTRKLKHSGDGLARRCYGLSHLIARVARNRPRLRPQRCPVYRSIHSGTTQLTYRQGSSERRRLRYALRRVTRRAHARLYHRVRVPRVARVSPVA